MRDIEKNYGINRGNSYVSNYTSKKSKFGKGIKRLDKRTVERVYMQFITCSVICITVIIISNFNNSFINKTVNGVKWAVGSNYDFKTAVANIRSDFIPGIDNKFKGLSGTVSSIINKNEVDKNDESTSPVANSSFMIMPIYGKITSGFGMREDPITRKIAEHNGIDIDGEKGAPIKSVLEGTVVKVGEDKTLGRFVRLKHNEGLETVYGHCSEILVKENQQIKQGDYIAKVGDTGVVTGPHLHFEIIKEGKAIDPQSVIEDIKESK